MNKSAYYFFIPVGFVYIFVILLFALNPISEISYFFIHLFALLGLTSLFIATIMTPFQRELFKIFGKPFIKIHHIFSLSGFVFISLHPIVLAITELNARVFLPVFSSWYDFWRLVGRPALFLIYIAVLASLLRKEIPKYWKGFHMLNYVGLIFGVIHGILLGATFYDFKEDLKINELLITITFLLMTFLSLATLGYKRYQQYKKKQKVNSKKDSKTISNEKEISE